jgi:hypothetical protein
VICVSDEDLFDYWTGDVDTARGAELEEHLFSCDKCAAANEELARLFEATRGAIPFVISHNQRERLSASGTRIQVTEVQAGVQASMRFTPDVDLHVFALRGDLAHAEHIDVEILSPTGEVAAVYERVPFDRGNGEILVACQRHYEGMFSGNPIFRVLVTERGQQGSARNYVVDHNWR